MEFDIPLLARLHEIDALVQAKYPQRVNGGLGQLGLVLLRPLQPWDYDSSPTNAWTFATTGGDGVHFGLLEIDGAVTEASPVVMTVPAGHHIPIKANAIVGSSLLNFLRFGLIRGYFAMEQLIYNRDLTLEVYASADWQPTEKSHDWVGYGVDETKKGALQLIASELSITPIGYTVAEYEALQEEYLPLLRLPPEEMPPWLDPHHRGE